MIIIFLHFIWQVHITKTSEIHHCKSITDPHYYTLDPRGWGPYVFFYYRFVFFFVFFVGVCACVCVNEK